MRSQNSSTLELSCCVAVLVATALSRVNGSPSLHGSSPAPPKKLTLRWKTSFSSIIAQASGPVAFTVYFP